jgi:hypothetical protein
MRALRLKSLFLVGLLAGYLLLDYGFMQARIPPVGFGVPLGELFLLAVLATTNLPVLASRFAAAFWALPLFLWWAIGFSRLFADSLGRGFWAFRDATQIIESLYILVGFAIAADMQNINTVIRALAVIIITAGVYGLCYPFRPEIAALSPVLYGASGETVPIIGTLSLAGTNLIWASFYLLTTGRRGMATKLLPMAGCFLIAFAVLIVQQRTTYFQLIGVMLLLLAFRPKALGPFALTIPVILLLVGVITAFGLHISGRLTNVSFDFLIEHVKAIAGSGPHQSGQLAAAAGGVGLRYDWWERIYRHVTEDGVNVLTGLGYGVPLTDFYDERGVRVREPHNSYISLVARLGVIGFVAWFWLQIELFRSWLRIYRQCRLLAWRAGEEFLLLVLAFSLLVLISAFGEDTMEKPYVTIPYYALWGLVLRLGYLLRSTNAHSPNVLASSLHIAGNRSAT